jgi:tetratricopeptide (TPR) repeat protein
MGLDRVDSILKSGNWSPKTIGVAETVRGPALYKMGAYDRALVSFENAIRIFDELGDVFEVCRARINLGVTLIEPRKFGAALRHLTTAVKVANEQKYERLQALGLSHLAVVHFHKEDLDLAERFAVRSNANSRKRDYGSLVFRNSFYLWKCANLKNDSAAIVSNEKTLRALVNRLREDLPEVDEYRRLREGGVR